MKIATMNGAIHAIADLMITTLINTFVHVLIIDETTIAVSLNGIEGRDHGLVDDGHMMRTMAEIVIVEMTIGILHGILLPLHNVEARLVVLLSPPVSLLNRLVIVLL
jgi:hypothetical protein